MTVSVSITNILNQFNKEIPFLQPLYEAIVNSLEANADTINIEFFTNDTLVIENKQLNPKIIGFKIVDNGDGFNQYNIKSFSEYLNDYKKKDFGCKGVGRFTWLKVFNNVKIESYTGIKQVQFDFNVNFDSKNIIPKDNCSEKGTTIVFEEVTEEYFSEGKSNAKTKDKRELADIKDIKEKIKENLLVKLFLLDTENKKNFNINLKINEETESIQNSDIIFLKKTSFTIHEDMEQKVLPEHTFNLYYTFLKNSKQKHTQSYCGNGRHVATFTNSTKIKKLPNNDSAVMLLTSEYLDERVNNERNNFIFQLGDNNANLSSPIKPAKIDSYLKTKIDKILLEEYPDITSENEQIVKEAVDEYPHLAKYIKDNKSIIKDKTELINNAKKSFEKEKEDIRKNFSALLKKNKIAPEAFEKNISKINELCAKELAEYFLYRDFIIQGLKKLNNDGCKCEADLHNIFMQMGEESFSNDDKITRYDTNIWLLDDKYMSYTGIFSDKQIKNIKKFISDENEKIYGEKKEPDLSIFYNGNDDKLKDLVVVEFKALDIRTDRKMVAMSEITRNLGYIMQCVDNIKSVYGYVITKMDEDFCRELSMQPGVKQLFSNGSAPLFYQYNDNLRDKNGDRKDCHIYYLSAETICTDAEARNKTFLDIVKNK